jgi:hypothetical protein
MLFYNFVLVLSVVNAIGIALFAISSIEWDVSLHAKTDAGTVAFLFLAILPITVIVLVITEIQSLHEYSKSIDEKFKCKDCIKITDSLCECHFEK